MNSCAFNLFLVILLSCIFAQIITINARRHKPHHSKCPECCEAPGSAGWTNLVRPGGSVQITNDTSAQSCCESCVADLRCAQWAFLATICQHNVPPIHPQTSDSQPPISDNSDSP
ncbi:20165_t:CDS:2, partial [Racocetra persica]